MWSNLVRRKVTSNKEKMTNAINIPEIGKERERDRERQREKGRERETEIEIERDRESNSPR